MTDPFHLACLYLQEQPDLRRLLSRMTGSFSMADDLVQDVFVRLIEAEAAPGHIRNTVMVQIVRALSDLRRALDM